jgi:hypothetical protein
MTVTAIPSIQRGIVFVMAQWSGQAKWAHQQLTGFLRQHPSALEHLSCIDVDEEPGVYDLPEFAGKMNLPGRSGLSLRLIWAKSCGRPLALCNSMKSGA